ncbi:hypothetical protein LZ32DRAFT_30688 [Colletotrichum eremochloae]|nr:hypothetical protein LZ32DRAFT_30688 [Colletotrichum eremochloae]
MKVVGVIHVTAEPPEKMRGGGAVSVIHPGSGAPMARAGVICQRRRLVKEEEEGHRDQDEIQVRRQRGPPSLTQIKHPATIARCGSPARQTPNRYCSLDLEANRGPLAATSRSRPAWMDGGASVALEGLAGGLPSLYLWCVPDPGTLAVIYQSTTPVSLKRAKASVTTNRIA